MHYVNEHLYHNLSPFNKHCTRRVIWYFKDQEHQNNRSTNMTQKSHRNSYGFTMVELSGAFLIIGVLVGGVLKGNQLIESAKVSATISQIYAIQAGYTSFNETWGIHPGDMSNAMDRIPGCTAVNNCENGNGDGKIGDSLNMQNGIGNDVSANKENALFWKHMALSDLMTDIQINASLLPETFAWDVSHPSNPAEGGYTIAHVNTGTPDQSGHILRWHSTPAGDIQTADQTEHIFQGAGAEMLDSRIDDGRPQSGLAIGQGQNCAQGNQNRYNTSTPYKNCWMAFLLNDSKEN